jgi:hypothetical protein
MSPRLEEDMLRGIAAQLYGEARIAGERKDTT